MVSNLFSPRKGNPILDKKTGEVVGYEDYITPKSGPFDEYYIDYEVVQVCKPVEGGSDEDFIITEKIKESKRKIQDVLDSQADDVGLDNMIKKFALTGDPSVLPQGVDATDEILDLTKFPSDTAEYMEYIQNLNKEYYSLTDDLREKMNPQEFVNSMTPEKLKNYIDSKQPKKDDVVKEGDK